MNVENILEDLEKKPKTKADFNKEVAKDLADEKAKNKVNEEREAAKESGNEEQVIDLEVKIYQDGVNDRLGNIFRK